MTTEFDIRPAVRKNSNFPIERLRVVQELSDLRLADVHVGIIFVYAVWSGSAVLALRQLTGLLSTLELGSLEVFILDNNCMTADDMLRLFGHVFHGYGEILWVRDGQVVAELPKYPTESESVVLTHTKELL